MLRSNIFGGAAARTHPAILPAGALRAMTPFDHFRYLDGLVSGRVRTFRGRPVCLSQARAPVQGAMLFWGLAHAYHPDFSRSAVAAGAGRVLNAWGARQTPKFQLTCEYPVPYVAFCRPQPFLSTDPATPGKGGRR